MKVNRAKSNLNSAHHKYLLQNQGVIEKTFQNVIRCTYVGMVLFKKLNQKNGFNKSIDIHIYLVIDEYGKMKE